MGYLGEEIRKLGFGLMQTIREKRYDRRRRS